MFITENLPGLKLIVTIDLHKQLLQTFEHINSLLKVWVSIYLSKEALN